MPHAHRLSQPSGLEMPDEFDPCGVPCLDRVHPRAGSHRRHQRALPGLAPTSLIASVEEVAAKESGEWLIWGTVGERPVLFAVEAAAAAEMIAAVTRGETATAIIEPCQLRLERLD